MGYAEEIFLDLKTEMTALEERKHNYRAIQARLCYVLGTFNLVK